MHCTATIRNDSNFPIEFHGALSKEYNFPAFCNGEKYKVFLVPEALTPDTATVYNNVLNGQHEFLNRSLDASYVLNRRLEPTEFCVVTIVVLSQTPVKCAAVPRAIFTYDDIALYNACELVVNDEIKTDPQFEIGVKLEYYKQRKFIPPDDGCVVIPFGQISYPESR